MSYEVTYTSTWKPSLSDSDVIHLKALGLFGALIKGNPYRSHLKRSGEESALCGAAPGESNAKRMRCRSGWLLYHSFERPGCRPCAKCLKVAENIDGAQQPDGSKK